ncbi:multicopper oxidase family protein [Nitratireductor sp. XY-223]|uniref:multicopper oxidase family protein n=1 Tax=Nitratireductor sp. XY-223 TaxID=2561926 RepID=UPI0010AA4D31|nr:multicopper oxidase family protein [Nitratireductor sp. XY-223]
MKLTRRDFLGSSAATAVFATVPLRVDASPASEDVLEITAGSSKQRLYRPDYPPSDLWTYNGSAPGPEIRVKRGQRVRVRFTNGLEEPTSIHWHGIRIDNAMDGVSGLTQDAVMPGEEFVYEFVAPDAGTYWYHAHNRSWNQVARGLYGALIIEEDDPVFDREHDLTLMADDWLLDRNGVLDVASLGSPMEWSHGGRLGNWLTVNGRSQPEFKLNAGEAYRLRLINVSNARILEIDPNRFDARVIAYDGQPLAQPEILNYEPLLIGPAQRVDFLIVPKNTNPILIEEMSGDRPFPFASLRPVAGGELKPEPAGLEPNSLPEPNLNRAMRFRLDMTGGAMGTVVETVYQGRKLKGSDFSKTGQVWAFNGIANFAAEPSFRCSRGETVIIETVNRTAFVHAMHVHGHHFRIIERSGSSVKEDSPWRDTFLVGPNQITTIAFVADNPGKWLFHCHMLEHAAAGMTTWFDVV